MRLRHIEVFHAVYTCGSITAAAKFLQVSQPSVSKVLAHAEMQLGYPLFDRVKGKVIPTLEAERLIGKVTSVYQSIDELQRISRNIAVSDVGRIRIAVTPAFGIDLIPSAIAAYLEQHPETKFEIETLHYHQMVRALNQSRIDIGVAFQPSAAPGINIIQLATAEFVAVTPEGFKFGAGGRVSLEDLAKHTFIRLSDRGPLGQLLASRLEDSGIEFDSVVCAETYQVAKALVAYGAGVTIIDEITAKSSGHNDVCALPLEPEILFDISLIYLESTPPSIVTQRFIAQFKSDVRQFLKQS